VWIEVNKDLCDNACMRIGTEVGEVERMEEVGELKVGVDRSK
jgi:hypothetical protein